MRVLESMLDRLSGDGVLLAIAVLWTPVFGGILVSLGQLMVHTGGVGILDFSLGYSPGDVAATFDAYGPEGFVLYRRIQLLDLLNPALYGLLLAGVLWRLAGRSSLRWCAVLPLGAAALDYAENATLFALSATYPDTAAALIHASSAIGIIKHLSLVVAVAGGAAVARSWLRRRAR